MEILHVISTLAASAGGPPMVASRLASAQAGLGHDVTIFCYEAHDGKEAAIDEFPQPESARPLKIERIPVGSKLDRVTGRPARRRADEIIPQYDVVHIHGIWEPIIRQAALSAKKLGKPYVIAPHGMLDEWALSQKSLKKKFALSVAYRSMIMNADVLHALSLYEHECLKNWGYAGRIETFPNGVFLEEIDPLPEPGSFYAEHPEFVTDGVRDPYILFLSRLHPVKRLDLLADAFAKIAPNHPTARLVIVGPDWGAQEALEVQIHDLGIGERVHLLGPVWGRGKYAAMVDAACFSLPSEHEAFSVAVTEALACACPVVISEECHFPEVEQEDAGEVVPLDSSKLAQALDRVLSDEPHRKRMASNGRRLVEERFTWPRIAEKTIGVYEQLARSS